MRRALLGLVLLVPATVLAGCGGDDPEPDPGLPSRDQLDSYFAAVASYDPERLTAAAKIAEPGSVAETYVLYLRALADAHVDGGTALDGVGVQRRGEEYRACTGKGDDSCVTWADIEGAGGKLTGFTVNDADIDDLLVTGDDETSDGPLADVSMLYAYKSPQSGTLFVLADVTTTDLAVEIGTSTATYDVPGGASTRGLVSGGPVRAGVGADVTALMAFPLSDLGGTASFDLTSPGADPQKIAFPVG